MYTLYPEEPIVIYIFHIFRIQLTVRSQSLLSLPMKRKTVELSIASTIISGNSIPPEIPFLSIKKDMLFLLS